MIRAKISIPGALELVAADLLSGEAVAAQVAVLHTFDPIRPNLLTFGGASPIGTDLLALGYADPLGAIAANLLAFDGARPLDTVGALRTPLERGHAHPALTALDGPLRALGARHGHALGPLDALRFGGPLATTAAAFH
ncbi:MAG TPA: hypothetical protein VFY95_04935 [Sphingomicrobium sp.]